MAATAVAAMQRATATATATADAAMQRMAATAVVAMQHATATADAATHRMAATTDAVQCSASTVVSAMQRTKTTADVSMQPAAAPADVAMQHAAEMADAATMDATQRATLTAVAAMQSTAAMAGGRDGKQPCSSLVAPVAGGDSLLLRCGGNGGYGRETAQKYYVAVEEDKLERGSGPWVHRGHVAREGDGLSFVVISRWKTSDFLRFQAILLYRPPTYQIRPNPKT